MKIEAQLGASQNREAILQGKLYRLKQRVQALEAELARVRSGAPISAPAGLEHLIENLREHRNSEPFPCVYFLTIAGKVVYVGQTINLSQRLNHHVNTKDYDGVFYLPVENPARLLDVERSYIRMLKPELNRDGLE